MRMRQALFYASRTRWHASQCSLPARGLRRFADARSIDEMVEKELGKPLAETQPIVGGSPIIQPVTIETKAEEQIVKAQIIFGSKAAGPPRKERDLDSESTWIAGVRVPPRPEEPDNCCMSGCVNCVWDRYREEYEEWQEKTVEAQAKLAEQRALKAAGSQAEHLAVSMDDDGGGSDTNWALNDKDPFADIPVGIREFMKTEKRLKQRHAAERAQL